MTKCFLSTVFCVLGLTGWEAQASALPAGFSEATVNGPAGAAWDQAVGLQFEDNGRMYVWEKAGRVWFQEYGSSSWTLLIDLSEEVGNWDDFGLLGFALDPNFRVNGNLYLMYVVDRHHLLHFGKPEYSPAANEYNDATIGRITRYTARAADGFTSVDYSTRRVLVGESPTNGFPLLYTSHGLGSLVFGEDGTLLASCGDGASWSSVDVGSAPETHFAQALTDGIIQPKENVGAYRAQLVDSLSGKIVRLDPATGDGVAGNPFYDAANPRAARSRVWALGLRNPFRMTLRPGTGSHLVADANPGVLYIGDAGYELWEDLDICNGPGQNFGWPVFEGIEAHPSYSIANVANLDAPNPAYPGSGCSQYFYFNNLVKQGTSVVANQPPFNNPCKTSQKIPSSIPQFLQTPPALDWKHGTTLARTWIYNGSGVATAINVGATGSPVAGSMFPGNCSIGGVWYGGSDFPAAYQNTYFHADYGANWIKNFVFDANDKPVSVSGFLTSGGGIVALATHPLEGGLYYIDINALALRKITYSVNGNLPPTAVATADQNYGPGPLSVQFAGNGSSDPEGGVLTYDWNFGDGSGHSAVANPQHTFTAAPGVPTKYNVTLTVTDNVAQTGTATLIISVNNTPPTVGITSPVDGSKYAMTGDTVYNLTASVTDGESADGQLKYEWRTYLHHNNHEHPGPVDTNHISTTVIAPVGCDGINIYYYRVALTVTDPAGLSTTRDVKIFPDCGAADQPPVISSLADQTVVQDQTTGPIGFTVSDAETAAANLQMSGVSSDPTLVPTGNIIFGDDGTNRTVTVHPAAGRTGTATITVTVNDGPNNTSTNFGLTVQAAPLGITTTTLPNGTTNAPYAATLVASGGMPPYSWSLAGGALPVGLTLSTNSGAISGTPTTVGTFNFTAQVMDASNPVQSVTRTLSLIVTTAPTAIGNTNDGTLTDAMGAGWINACRFQAVGDLTVNTMAAKVGAITGRYKCAIYTDNGGQPNRLLRTSAEVINPAAGWQSFPLAAPQALTNGQFYWLGIWSDAGNSKAYYSGTSGTIRWGNYTYGTWPDPLVTTGGGSLSYCIYATGSGLTATDLAVSMVENTSTNLTLLGSAVGGVLSYAILSGPTNGVLNGLDANSGAVTYAPNLNYNGTDHFRFTVSDGSLSATGLVSVTVTAVNDAPVAADLAVGMVENTSTNLTLLGSDVDGVVSYAILSGPTNGVLNGLDANSGAVTYAPNLNYNGMDHFRFTVSDGSLSATGLVSVTVTAVNDAPVAADLAVGMVENTSTNLTLLGSDVEGVVSYAILSGPTNGVLNGLDTNSGSVTYTPNLNYNGADHFWFTVSDGSLSATGLVSVTVTAVNDAPVATDVVVETPEDTSTNLTLLGSDVEGAVIFGILSGPTNGVLNGLDANSGAVTYAPNLNYNGTDHFRFTVSDGSLSATGLVSVTVTAVNDAPVANDDNFNLGAGVALDISAPGVLANDSDAEGDSLTAILVSGPLQGKLNLEPDGGFNYTPTNHFSGVDTFTYRVSDGQTNSETGTVGIAVSNKIQITSIVVADGVVTLSWTSIPGKIYRLQFKDSWTDLDWQDASADVTAVDSDTTGTNAVDTVTQRFYRVLCLGNN